MLSGPQQFPESLAFPQVSDRFPKLELPVVVEVKGRGGLGASAGHVENAHRPCAPVPSTTHHHLTRSFPPVPKVKLNRAAPPFGGATHVSSCRCKAVTANPLHPATVTPPLAPAPLQINFLATAKQRAWSQLNPVFINHAPIILCESYVTLPLPRGRAS
ncbi:hypothetical protein AAFF_G00061310 [Aldrovandia affinis]|uniref:Uncharacterized protein n=1 Tax=Aldrovandia affinis TaxID=143900 RepID=A0AAD7RZV9_9TELE|nr:hypothetical protein AAFF_G00061310 [Aldrovandia affinis]